MVSLLAVFKDICPGYRIRLPTDKELEVKVSKEVQRVRDYEAALLKSYQNYLRTLLQVRFFLDCTTLRAKKTFL